MTKLFFQTARVRGGAVLGDVVRHPHPGDGYPRHHELLHRAPQHPRPAHPPHPVRMRQPAERPGDAPGVQQEVRPGQPAHPAQLRLETGPGHGGRGRGGQQDGPQQGVQCVIKLQDNHHK